MEYLALYRKYRPKELNEVVGQNDIKKILASSVTNGTISHAYLFSGPRGTGKTTMAKIFAKMVNCLNPVDGDACNKCEICKQILESNDIIEIDAASNNGVDEIRELREKANLVPSIGKYKVYIIDEVHMLTTQAFNALLKTLEEPPKHVIFVLATTEYYKIPLTITSRCQKFQFTKISNNDVVMRLKEISSKEKIKITDDALLEIANISDGGLRDSINFLDQLRSFNNKEISLNDVYDVCGRVSYDEYLQLLTAIRNNNFEVVSNFFKTMSENGKSYTKFLDDIVLCLKDVALFKKNVNLSYMKCDENFLKSVSSLYSIDNIFYMIDAINNLFDRLRNTSRQSVVIIANFLLMMYKLNDDKLRKDVDIGNDINLNENTYNMAFQFTQSDQKNDADLTDNQTVDIDNIALETSKIDNINYDENKGIIINNTFALASKDKKKDLQNRIKKIDIYLTNKKYKAAAVALVDTDIEVAGGNYVILSAANSAIVEKVYKNYKLCSELLNIIFDDNYNFVLLNYDEWCKYRDNYVENFRKGIKYHVQELKNSSIIDESNVKNNTVVDKLFDLVGEDIVEFK